MNNFTKDSQQRSLTKRVTEFLNPKERFRRWISSQYQEVSDLVREIDDDMRERALSNDPTMREAIHEARMAFKNREFPRVIYYAWTLIDLTDNILARTAELEQSIEQAFEQFYGRRTELSDEQLRKMHESLGIRPLSEQPKMPATTSSLKKLLYTKAAPDPKLVSTAGVTEWLKENIPTWKEMEGSIMDRIFRNKMGKQKNAAQTALRIAEQLYGSIKSVFKELEGARTDPNKYVNIIKKYKELFNEKKNQLSVLYQQYFSDIVPQMTQYNTDEQPQQQPQQQVEIQSQPISPEVAERSEQAAREAIEAQQVQEQATPAVASEDLNSYFIRIAQDILLEEGNDH